LQAAVKNRPFLFSMGIFLFTGVALDIVQVTLLYFIKYGVQRAGQSDLILGTVFFSAIVALPFWERASRIWNKRLAYILGIAFWAGVQIVLVTLSPATNLSLIFSLCILAGIGVGAGHVLPWSMIPDSIEWDEWKTGERHEGMFYSLVTLAQKVASSIAIPLTLLVLGFTGYVPNAAQQPPKALFGIRIIAGPIPTVFLCLGILFASLYPLGREEYTRIKQELEERRAQKTSGEMGYVAVDAEKMG
jgi:GPH family glycoside/pentoside/hexuronide:cation symporter